MTSFSRRIYEMLVRLVVFSRMYPQFFAKDTLPGQLMAQIEAVVQKLSGHVTSQTTGSGAAKVSADDRRNARTALRHQLETIGGIAKALNLTQFWRPRNRSDVVLVSVGKTWLRFAQDEKQKFIWGRTPEF